jgi:hypothetical protein
MMGLPAEWVYKAYLEMNGRGGFGCMVLLHQSYLDKDQCERRLRLVAI